MTRTGAVSRWRPPAARRAPRVTRGFRDRRDSKATRARRDPGAVESVIALDARVREVISERAFASFAAGEVAGVAYLYSDGDGVGQVEDVLTIPVHRGHGHARSVVLAAMAASRAAGHQVTFLWADENDWPKALYARLGFDVVGRRWRYRRLSL